MAGESSVYERKHPTRAAQAFGVCFGRITAVNTTQRTCTVKTFSSVPDLNDLHIKACQWLSMDASPKGDESTAVPRRGSIGLVIFVDGESFWLGYFKGLNAQKGAITEKEAAPKLTEGDKVISTAAGNKITVKSSGLIEIESGPTLKTVYIPSNSGGPARLLHLTRDYELKTDGGFEKWSGTDAVGSQVNQKVFRRDLAATFVVIEERGNLGGSVIYRTSIAPGLAGLGGPPMYMLEIDITGESRITVGPGVPTYTAKIGVDGKWEVEAASGVSMKTQLGKIELTAAFDDIIIKNGSGAVNISSELGDVSVKAATGAVSVQADVGNVSVKAALGDIEMEGSQAKLKLAKGMVAIGGPAAELLELFSQTLQGIAELLTNLQTETHMGNLGYPTAPPLNAAAYAQTLGKISQTLGLLSSIKGSL